MATPTLNGITPEQLISRMELSAKDFSMADNAIKYQGKKLYLVDGQVQVSDGADHPKTAKTLFERVVEKKPEIRTILTPAGEAEPTHTPAAAPLSLEETLSLTPEEFQSYLGSPEGQPVLLGQDKEARNKLLDRCCELLNAEHKAPSVTRQKFIHAMINTLEKYHLAGLFQDVSESPRLDQLLKSIDRAIDNEVTQIRKHLRSATDDKERKNWAAKSHAMLETGNSLATLMDSIEADKKKETPEFQTTEFQTTEYPPLAPSTFHKTFKPVMPPPKSWLGYKIDRSVNPKDLNGFLEQTGTDQLPVLNREYMFSGTTSNLSENQQRIVQAATEAVSVSLANSKEQDRMSDFETLKVHLSLIAMGVRRGWFNDGAFQYDDVVKAVDIMNKHCKSPKLCVVKNPRNTPWIIQDSEENKALRHTLSSEYISDSLMAEYLGYPDISKLGFEELRDRSGMTVSFSISCFFQRHKNEILYDNGYIFTMICDVGELFSDKQESFFHTAQLLADIVAPHAVVNVTFSLKPEAVPPFEFRNEKVEVTSET